MENKKYPTSVVIKFLVCSLLGIFLFFVPVSFNGKSTIPDVYKRQLFDIMKSQKHYFDSLAKVSPERKRLENPHSYKVDLSSDLINLKYGLINKIKNV